MDSRIHPQPPADPLEQLTKRVEALEAKQEKSSVFEHGCCSFTINRRPLFKKLTCGIVDPERKLVLQMLKRGAGLVGVDHLDKKHVRLCFRNP